jgi:hypothetical protein
VDAGVRGLRYVEAAQRSAWGGQWAAVGQPLASGRHVAGFIEGRADLAADDWY